MVEMCHGQGLLAVVDDGSVIGFAAGVMAPSLAAPTALVGTEVAWWINPSIRGAGYGIMLLDFMEDLARDLGIKYWNMVAMESSMPQQVKSMYLDRGYTLQESTFTKVL